MEDDVAKSELREPAVFALVRECGNVALWVE